jgi:hypothetical protein
MGGGEGECKYFVGKKARGKGTIRRTKLYSVDNIKMNVEEV